MVWSSDWFGSAGIERWYGNHWFPGAVQSRLYLVDWSGIG
jgi:hypothetical protein